MMHMANHQQSFVFSAEKIPGSPQEKSTPCSFSEGLQPNTGAINSSIRKQLDFASPNSSSKKAAPHKIREQLLSILSNLEFRRSFLVLSYIGKQKLEEAMAVNDANQIVGLKNASMKKFEAEVWKTYGRHHCLASDRIEYLDWDSGKTHLYHCHVNTDGSYIFKGPYLDTTKTHLQRALGDENVLIVKFAEEKASDSTNSDYLNISQQGILVCLRRFRFFVYKDGGKAEKKKGSNSNSSAVKCYFVRMESSDPNNENYLLSNKTVHEARSMFMHLHTVPSMAKYAARCSLILSKTIKLQIDLNSVTIREIDDISCYDENGCIVYNEDGERLIHTDGTGFISEDLAMMCPEDFRDAKFLKDQNFEFLYDTSMELRDKKTCIREPPLLIQCRLFKDGLAVKGTLLLNKTLKNRTIEIRPSMIKVQRDPQLHDKQSFNSLEAVAVSHKPRKATLSKNLIALLCYGGVRPDFFLGLLEKALEDAQTAKFKKITAVKVGANHGEIDDDYITTRMIASGIDLDEPYLDYKLSHLTNEEKKGFKIGRLPISESFYLMGTVDPTGLLNRDEVCVILDNGQISGKVLVYRNPGLHFGDIHVLNAVYIEKLHEYVGNAKFAIFFSTKGPRSVGNEFANGDFDGDMYWVSKHPQLLEEFKPSEPWKQMYSTPKAANTKPSDLTPQQLEDKYFQSFLDVRNQSSCMGVAADSWQSLMDRLLTLSDKCFNEKERMKTTMLKLIDIYYDALDSAKSGKKVNFPEELKVELMPHFMERVNKYESTSVLGLMYDKILYSESDTSSLQEISKLPCFDVEISKDGMHRAEQTYKNYRKDMMEAMCSDDESKNYLANGVIKKYKQMLYGASEFDESTRNKEDIYNDAIALYHAVYDYANSLRDVKKCGFVWKVAGVALCKFIIGLTKSRSTCPPIEFPPSVLKEIFG